MTITPISKSTPTRSFLLNTEVVPLESNDTRLLLDLLRRDMRLVGTKEGCREGDCGACAVLLGEAFGNESITYRAVPSCMLLAGHLAGRHVVTIEGLNHLSGLSPQQSAIVESGATQCGFCTPGFVVSFTSFLLNAIEFTVEEASLAIGGNLCRCTGYVSLVRAAAKLVTEFNGLLPPGQARINSLVAAGALPKAFLDAPKQLLDSDRTWKEQENLRDEPERSNTDAPLYVAGGTDLIVQRGPTLDRTRVKFAKDAARDRIPFIHNNELTIPSETTFEELRRSPAFATVWPRAEHDLKLFASALIRELATVGGNIANASPIADGTAMLLALDAEIDIESVPHSPSGGQAAATRSLRLADFFLGYKQVNLAADEHIRCIRIRVEAQRRVHFAKISKRTHLDIATVNSGLGIYASKAGIIESITISAGGVAATPLRLTKTAAFLVGKQIANEVLIEAALVLDTEIAPIDDVRGSAAYKRLALQRLFFAHFLTMYPQQAELLNENELIEALR